MAGLSVLVLWENMSLINKGVVIILILLSVWSLYVCVERWLLFRKARKQSLEFARLATDHLKHDRPKAAIDAAMKYPQSHLARVVAAGLQSFEYESTTSPLAHEEIVEAAGRAVERAALLTTSDFKRGIGTVSAGIAEALVSTAFGLGVAIPAAWMFNYFTNQLERLQVEMSNSASELIDFFMKQRSRNAAAPR